MIKSLIIKFAMFTETQNVFIEYSNGTITKVPVSMNDLPKFIANSRCEKVYAYGLVPFTKKFEAEVRNKYNNTDIVWYYNDRKKSAEIIEKHYKEKKKSELSDKNN